MNDQSHQAPLVPPIDSKSSIFEKTDPDLRRRLDRAIVDRRPPTYQAIYDEFGLHDLGISFTAFYYYASRLRTNAAFIGLAQISLPEGAAVSDLLPDLLGQRLFDASIDEETSAGTLCRIAQAYRIAAEARYARCRFSAEFEDEKRKARIKENRELFSVVNQYLKARRADGRAETRAARDAIAAREAGEDPAAPEDAPRVP